MPSSTIKTKSLSFAVFPPVNEDSDDDDAIPATDHRPRHRNALAETPSKARVAFAALPFASPDEDVDEEQQRERDNESPLRESPSLLRTPSKPKRPWVSITPSKPNFTGLSKEKEKSAVVAATPVKAIAATPVKSGSASESLTKEVGNAGAESQSIYDALGWNDDFDDL